MMRPEATIPARQPTVLTRLRNVFFGGVWKVINGSLAWTLLLILAMDQSTLVRGGETAAGEVSLVSLLNEMIDRESVAQCPVPAFVLKQASSHDQRKNDPSNADTWHSNTDYGQFLHTETNEGRREWVIMDDAGPGAITRFWVPLLGDNDNQIIRFYFDGSPIPAITAKLNELLSGTAFVRPPLAFVGWNETNLHDQLKPEFKARRGVSGDLYLPIPFARSCKITLDSLPFYYVINYRQYVAGTPVQTFSLAGFEAARATLDRVSATLLATPDQAVVGPTKQATLAPGQTVELELPKSSAAVRGLQVRIDPRDAPQVLRSTILQGAFDGEAAIWCPLGEFFGAGVRLNPVRDWWRTVGADGTLTARWVMPYRHSGRFSLKNGGDKTVALEFSATTDKWRWNDRSCHFHGNWHCQLDLQTRPRFDWNYLEIQGRGRYVGDTLTVFSPVKAWYGEGDERIYYDGATFPQMIGTGTEDYYGYAWGMAGYFDSPFISAQQRDGLNQDDWRGYTTTSRLRLLDSIPIQTSLKHDLEIWNWADTQVDYAVGTFWYARPAARNNREPQPREAARPLRENPVITDQRAADYKIAGAIECETLPVAAKSGGLEVGIQDAGLTEGQWSGGRHLFVQATKPGDFVELQIPTDDDQPREVILYVTKSADYGILRCSLNGKPAGNDIDTYHAAAVAGGPVELGTFAPKNGKLLLRVEVIGCNPASLGARYFFGLDCLVLKRP